MLLAVLCSFHASAWQVENDHFKARLVLGQPRAYLGEEVALSLELATPQWFTRAATIRLPSQPDVMWLQRQVFADNRRQNIDGRMWTVQRWPIAVFPRRAGNLLLLPVVVEVGVADSLGRDQPQRVSLGGLSLLGVAPTGFSLVANDYRVQVSVADQPLRPEQPLTLAAGETVELAYHSQAEDSLAMFLPDIVPSILPLDGIAVYPQLPTLLDDNERGRRTAKRTDRYILVAQQPVSVFSHVDPIDWFDKQRGEKSRLVIPAIGIAETEPTSMVNDRDRPLVVWLMLMLIIVAVYIVAERAPRAMTPQHKRRYVLQQACLRAARQGDWQVLATQLYALHDSYPASRGQPIRTTLAKLCHNDSLLRLNTLLDTAYAGAVTSVDTRDEAHLNTLFKALSAQPMSTPEETPHASFVL
jgi:hypothetical protein